MKEDSYEAARVYHMYKNKFEHVTDASTLSKEDQETYKTWLRAKFTFPFSDKIIGNSKAGLIGYSAPSKKCTCIYNGMDFNRFKTLNDPNVLRRENFFRFKHL